MLDTAARQDYYHLTGSKLAKGMDHSGHEGSHGSGSSATATKPPSSASSSSSSSSSAAADHSAHSSSGSEHMSMRPYLFSSTTDFYILFKQARIGNTGGFVLAFFMTFLFGILTTVGFEFGKRLERSALAAKLVKERKAFPRVVVGALGHGLRLLLH